MLTSSILQNSVQEQVIENSLFQKGIYGVEVVWFVLLMSFKHWRQSLSMVLRTQQNQRLADTLATKLMLQAFLCND